MLFFPVLIWASLVFGKKLIKTSALLQCQSSSEFEAQKFDVVFHPENNTASLDLEIMSTIDGNFSVDVNLYVYGIHILDQSISGCDISQTICPMAPGRFDVRTDFDVPKEYADQIPGVAYTVPNIDAYVQAKVYYVDESGNKQSNDTAACVIAELSNDMTVQHQYVSWILFGIIIAGVLMSAVTALSGNSRTASQIISNTVSLFTYFQGMAIVGMMAVYRLPPIAAAWVQNFVWTTGIFSVGFMQKACHWYVKSTGGKATTILANKDDIAIAVFKKRSIEEAVNQASRLVKRVGVDLSSNMTTTNQRDSDVLKKTLVLQGIQRVSFLSNIELSNFFVTGAAAFIFIGIFLVLALLLSKGVLELLVKMNALDSSKLLDFRLNYYGYTKGTLFRYFVIGFTQMSLLCLWEFTDHVSAATTVIAVVMFLILVTSLLVAVSRVLILGTRSKQLFSNPASVLFGNPEVFSKWGFLYVQYKASTYWFIFPFLVYTFARSATIGLGQSNGKAQAITLVVVEIIYFVALCIVKPYMSKSMNGYNIAIGVFSIVNAIFFMFFSNLFGSKVDVASAIMGVVYFVMNAIVCFAYLVALIVECLIAVFHPHPDDRYEPVSDDRNLFMPSNDDQLGGTELDDLGNTAKDGYRHSYLNYEPEHGSQFGAVPAHTETLRPNNKITPPDSIYYDEDAPATALRDNFNYRQEQSRGVVQDHVFEDSDHRSRLI